MPIKKEEQNLQDLELIASVVMDDHDAFRDLFYSYNNSIVSFLVAMTGSAQAAEDISQDIFAYVWENRRKLTNVRNFKSYLFTIARNASFKFIRQDQKLCDLSDETVLGDAAETHALDESLVAEETKLLVKIAVSRMPRLRQAVFTMSRYDGLTNDQIAKKLGISNESVASHINTAKKEIRKLIMIYLLFLHFPY